MRLALAALALLAATVPGRAAPKPEDSFRTLTNTLVRGHCQMDECEWFSIVSAHREGEANGAVLMNVRVKELVADYPDGDYSRKIPLRSLGISTTYFLCSKANPSFIGSSGHGGWEQTPLSLGDPLHIYVVTEYITSMYWAACEGVKVENTDTAGPKAVTLGYSAHVAEGLSPPLKIAKPTDALTRQVE